MVRLVGLIIKTPVVTYMLLMVYLIGQKCPVMREGGNAVALHVASLQHLVQHFSCQGLLDYSL